MSTGEFIRHVPCASCGSSDAGALYSDGNIHCHKCGITQFANSEQTASLAEGLIEGEYAPLVRRKITEETCKLYKYQLGAYNGKAVHIASYFKNGKIVAQKIRDENKEFTWFGSSKDIGLFGDHIWGSGKRIVITEGEIDAMSVSQAMGNKWPVVSLKNGADLRGTGVKKELSAQLPYLNNFEEIILMFDMDEPGQASAHEAAKILPIGKVKIASLPMKDANEMLVAGKIEELVNAVWRAKPYVPDGLVDKSELRTKLLTKRDKSKHQYSFPVLNSMTYGIRTKEIVLIAGGSGLGKSSFVRQIAFDLMNTGEKVGFITLEEDAQFTSECLVGFHLGKNLRFSEDNDPNEIGRIFDTQIAPYAEFYDDQGGINKHTLKLTIEYMALASGCKWIVFDHISMSDSEDGTGERESLDNIMKTLRNLAQRLDIGIFVVTQLRKPSEGKDYDEGRHVKRKDVRGSGALDFNANVILGFEGDTTNGNSERHIYILKNRFSGTDVGKADTVVYDKQTGFMTPVSFVMKQPGEAF